MTTSGISSPFELLFQTSGQVTNAILTRSPLGRSINKYEYKFQGSSFDLHVLGTPPAFILSQDQTLRKKISHLKMCKLRIYCYWIDRKKLLLASYHYSVVKVLVS